MPVGPETCMDKEIRSRPHFERFERAKLDVIFSMFSTGWRVQSVPHFSKSDSTSGMLFALLGQYTCTDIFMHG